MYVIFQDYKHYKHYKDYSINLPLGIAPSPRMHFIKVNRRVLSGMSSQLLEVSQYSHFLPELILEGAFETLLKLLRNPTKN